MKRVVLAIVMAVACAACTRQVVLDPPPDGSSALPDAVGGHDGGGGDGGVQDGGVQDGGGLPDAGVIGDAALGG